MKRDFDLIRKILLTVENRSHEEQGNPIKIEGYTEEEISYNVKLLHEAGYVNAIDASNMDGLCWRPSSLTWRGHDFLDAARENSRWETAKKIVKEKAGTVTLAALQEVLVSLMKRAIGL
jgi:hypothetical protein